MNTENPFTITFGKQPNRQISRYEATDSIVSTFNAENAVSQVFMIEGIRGSGKTVLMTTVAKLLKEDKNWVVINLNPAMDLLSGFAVRLNEAVSNKPEILSKGFNISAAGFGLGLNGDDKITDHVGVIEKCLSGLRKKKKRVLITIDEVVHDENMKVFASQFQIFLREDYPVFLIMTGLYENIENLQNERSLTFLYRATKLHPEPLNTGRVASRYSEIFNISYEHALELSRMTRGYPFAFQALGFSIWNNGVEKRDWLPEYRQLLEEYVYEKIWSE